MVTPVTSTPPASGRSQGRISLARLAEIKRAGGKFSVLTCYDAAMARLMETAGVEVLLVGDTAAEVILGLSSTREVAVEFMLTLTAAVRRGAPTAVVMADLPYACRRDTSETAVRWARRFLDETGCDVVKVELTGGDAPLVEAMTAAGVPVVAHLGLLPQWIDPRTGYRAQGKDAASAEQLIADARRLEEAGARVLLLEAVADEVARHITLHTNLPVIGCVSGPHCDGTVVVLHDLLGLGGGHPPRGVQRYANLAEELKAVFARYVADVHAGRFPTEKDAIHMSPGEMGKLLGHIGEA